MTDAAQRRFEHLRDEYRRRIGGAIRNAAFAGLAIFAGFQFDPEFKWVGWVPGLVFAGVAFNHWSKAGDAKREAHETMNSRLEPPGA